MREGAVKVNIRGELERALRWGKYFLLIFNVGDISWKIILGSSSGRINSEKFASKIREIWSLFGCKIYLIVYLLGFVRL